MAVGAKLGLLSTTSSSGNLDLTFSGYLRARQGILRKMFNGSQCCRTPSVIRSHWRIARSMWSCDFMRLKKGVRSWTVQFVAAKSRVALLKQLTIPCSELQTAVLESYSAKSMHDESKLQFTLTQCFCTHSLIASARIHNPFRNFKTLVSLSE